MANIKLEIKNDWILIIKDGLEEIIIATIPISEKEAFLLFSIEKDKRDELLEIILKAYTQGCEDGKRLEKKLCLSWQLRIVWYNISIVSKLIFNHFTRR